MPPWQVVRCQDLTWAGFGEYQSVFFHRTLINPMLQSLLLPVSIGWAMFEQIVQLGHVMVTIFNSSLYTKVASKILRIF